MDSYINIALVKAKSCKYGTYIEEKFGSDVFKNMKHHENLEGYSIECSNKVIKWLPKDKFERTYFCVVDKVSITGIDVNNFIKSIEYENFSNVIRITMTCINGFVLSAIKIMFDENVNSDYEVICKDEILKMKYKVFHHLEFMLFCIHNGMKMGG